MPEWLWKCFICKNFPMQDRSDYQLKEVTSRILPLIRNYLKKNFKVVVFCEKGLSWAPSVIINYLMEYENMSFEEGMEHLGECYPQYDINLGFLH